MGCMPGFNWVDVSIQKYDVQLWCAHEEFWYIYIYIFNICVNIFVVCELVQASSNSTCRHRNAKTYCTSYLAKLFGKWHTWRASRTTFSFLCLSRFSSCAAVSAPLVKSWGYAYARFSVRIGIWISVRVQYRSRWSKVGSLFALEPKTTQNGSY